MLRRTIVTQLTALALLAGAPSAALSQLSGGAAACFGFAFGAWTPALDLRAGGHDPSGPRAPAAPAGRDWADEEKGREAQELVLFPAWWPAGVVIAWEGRAPAEGDTVVANATALVADARKTPPRAKVRAWRVDCATQAARRED